MQESARAAKARANAVFPKDRAIRASDGTRIAYTVLGRGDRVPVVFINGWSCTDGYWVSIGPAVRSAGHPVVFIDTRGHGQSGLPRAPGLAASKLRPEDVAIDRVARDFIEVLDDAGIERAVFAGHSMGVQAIMETYHIGPDRIAGLVPIAGTFENPVRSFADLAFLDRLYPVAEFLFRFTPFEVLRPVVRRTASPSLGHRVIRAIRVGGPKVREDDIAPHMAHIAESNFSVLFKMMSGLRKQETAHLLPSIAAPTLVLAGRRDLFTPPSVQQRMADLIPGAEIVWFEDGGHLLPVEEPEGCAAAIIEFLARRVDSGAGGASATGG
jgi:pimeloyl-ACP methyl ester carboxylesterase